ncbi:hypothetical protein ACHAWU_000602 [Discostella pseudostelligera]|uniref:CRAL-TRIO domain-containing protein n=1 Tax=Discostella pseudostelligera TaxID=259834 RepID=A0ABD3M7K0_9STRA
MSQANLLHSVHWSTTYRPDETPDFLLKSHRLLLDEIDKLPNEKKAGWLMAREKCDPTLVGEDHRLMFLRCELFNIELAAQRIANYWNRRIELFGNDRAFKPLHLGEDGAITPINDNDDSDNGQFGGRAILFADPSRFAGYDKNNNDERMGVVRALWLIFHSVIMGNDLVQKLGVVVVVFPHHAKISIIDRKLIKMNIESLSGCLPIRVGGFHICHPPWFFGKFVYPIMKVVMPSRMSKRIRVHVGSEEKVLENLKQFGLEKKALPSDIGGDIVL